jgi:hypothetical protein
MTRTFIPIFLGAALAFAAFVCGCTGDDLGNAPDCRYIQYENIETEYTEEEVIIPEGKDDVYANEWGGSVIKSPEFYRITTAIPPQIFNADKARQWTRVNEIGLKREWNTEDVEFAKIMQSIWEATYAGNYNADYRSVYNCKAEENMRNCSDIHIKIIRECVKSIETMGFACKIDDFMQPTGDFFGGSYFSYIFIDISW